MNYPNKPNYNEENDELVNRPKSHWEKYKVYYLVLGSFFFILLVILLSNLGVNRRLRNLERKQIPTELWQKFSKYLPKGGGGRGGGNRKDSDHIEYIDHEFTFPKPSEQSKYWWKDIYQEKVREKVEKNYINYRYLPNYQTTKATPKNRNIIFYGPPGTGKTHYANLLAKNEACCYTTFAAGELGTIYRNSAREMWDDTLKQVRENLLKARITNPDPTKWAIIIIDEIDAILGKKKDYHGGDVDNSLFTAILDDLEKLQKENIMIIGTTNDLGLITKSAIRPGRFDCQIHIPAPQTETERRKLIDYLQQEIVKYYKTTTNRTMWKNLDETKIVEFSPDFWEKVHQTTKDITQKYEKWVQPSFIMFKTSLETAILKNVTENSQKIVPDVKDYAEELTNIVKREIEALRERIPTPLPPLPNPTPYE